MVEKYTGIAGWKVFDLQKTIAWLEEITTASARGHYVYSDDLAEAIEARDAVLGFLEKRVMENGMRVP